MLCKHVLNLEYYEQYANQVNVALRWIQVVRKSFDDIHPS